MTRRFKALRDAECHIAFLEHDRSQLLCAVTALVITENRKRDAAKKKGEPFRRSRAGRLAIKALKTLRT